MAKQKFSSRPGRRGRYDRYRLENRREKNKKAKLQRHLKRYPEDMQAQRALG